MIKKVIDKKIPTLLAPVGWFYLLVDKPKT